VVIKVHDLYENPLITRYASKEMARCFSDERKFQTWRKLWVALAEAEKELGLPITQQQIDELKAHQCDINYEVAEAKEREVRHDVMAHIHAYGEQCPTAKAIIHLGATSCYVGDNADILQCIDALKLTEKKLVSIMSRLASFAMEHRALPTLAFTHYQPAQLTTVGKRASLWLQEFHMDYGALKNTQNQIRLLGVKGTTGTQASFMTLFNEDEEIVKALEDKVTAKLGVPSCFPVSGQTYPRKLDTFILQTLENIAQSAYKLAGDVRLLQNLKEIEEPFEKSQIGSSAMAYKRNPMRSERICSLARFVMSLSTNTLMTASTQWFERTLDDSANRRLVIPQAFLAIDGVLNLCLNIMDGLVVYPKIIDSHISAELPFMATETILMEAVKQGGDRQALHERIRVHSMEAARQVKEQGKPNDLIDRIAGDEAFKLTQSQIGTLLNPVYFTGRASSQVAEYIRDEIMPILDAYGADTQMKSDVHV